MPNALDQFILTLDRKPNLRNRLWAVSSIFGIIAKHPIRTYKNVSILVRENLKAEGR